MVMGRRDGDDGGGEATMGRLQCDDGEKRWLQGGGIAMMEKI